MRELCEFIGNATSTVYFDFSWTQMKGKELAQIADAFNSNNSLVADIRAINLSYNTLQFDQGKETNAYEKAAREHSEHFIESFLTFLRH